EAAGDRQRTGEIVTPHRRQKPQRRARFSRPGGWRICHFQSFAGRAHIARWSSVGNLGYAWQDDAIDSEIGADVAETAQRVNNGIDAFLRDLSSRLEQFLVVQEGVGLLDIICFDL